MRELVLWMYFMGAVAYGFGLPIHPAKPWYEIIIAGAFWPVVAAYHVGKHHQLLMKETAVETQFQVSYTASQLALIN